VRVTVVHAGGDEYTVSVEDRTTHTVSAPESALRRLLNPGESPEDGLVRVFRFLLDREPPESILRRFAVDDVQRYFPEFWSEVGARRGG